MAHIKLHLRVTRSLVELVKGFEGLRRRAARLADGGWTVGYGHSRTARDGVVVGPEDGEALLYYDLSIVAERVEAWTFTPLNQNQFEALTAFAFNIGLENFRTSDVLRHVNAGRPLEAASALERWNLAEIGGETQTVDALVRRRAAEKAHFLTPPDGFRPSPTPVIRPMRRSESAAGVRDAHVDVPVGPRGAPAEDLDKDSPAAPSGVAQAGGPCSAAVHALRAIDAGLVDVVSEEETVSSLAPLAPLSAAAALGFQVAGPTEALNDGPFGLPPRRAKAARAMIAEGSSQGATPPSGAALSAPPPRVPASPNGIVVGVSAPGAEVSRQKRGGRDIGRIEASETADVQRRRPSNRLVFALMGLGGAALFVGAALSLTLGRAEGANLAIGLFGVLLITIAGGYFLLRVMRIRDGSLVG